MSERRRQLRANLAAFGLLFGVSLYRQLSLRFLPGDPFRTWILYLTYVFLILLWGVSLAARVTQRHLRLFLLLEDVCIFCGLTIRFVQDTFLTGQIRLLRVSGLLVAVTCLPYMLFGLYAALGIGQADSYLLPRKWFALAVPIAALMILTLTDEAHHLVFALRPEEPQPNLNFHPNAGLALYFLLGIAVALIRVLVIYRHNRILRGRRALRVGTALLEPILLLLITLPYLLVSTGLVPALAGVEVIELFAKIYYVEVITWECYIYLGLVPVNTNYREIFEQAPLGLQILGDDGLCLRSEEAEELPESVLEELRRSGVAVTAEGRERHRFRLADAEVIWSRDVSPLQQAVEHLRQNAEVLGQESELLAEELRRASREAGVEAKNRIYDELTAEVQGTLNRMRRLLREAGDGAEPERVLAQLCLLGVYVKRRCNLKLIRQEGGQIPPEDLRISLQDVLAQLAQFSVEASLRWDFGEPPESGFGLRILDELEAFLETALEETEAVPEELRLDVSGNEARLQLSGGAPGAWAAALGKRPAWERLPAEEGRITAILRRRDGGENA